MQERSQELLLMNLGIYPTLRQSEDDDRKECLIEYLRRSTIAPNMHCPRAESQSPRSTSYACCGSVESRIFPRQGSENFFAWG